MISGALDGAATVLGLDTIELTIGGPEKHKRMSKLSEVLSNLELVDRQTYLEKNSTNPCIRQNLNQMTSKLKP